MAALSSALTRQTRMWRWVSSSRRRCFWQWSRRPKPRSSLQLAISITNIGAPILSHIIVRDRVPVGTRTSRCYRVLGFQLFRVHDVRLRWRREQLLVFLAAHGPDQSRTVLMVLRVDGDGAHFRCRQTMFHTIHRDLRRFRWLHRLSQSNSRLSSLVVLDQSPCLVPACSGSEPVSIPRA